MIASGNISINLSDILSKTTEANILAYYLGITKVPCIINSPLRKDKKPSFGLYSLDGKRIYYTDLATKDKGGLFDLLGKIWNCTYKEVLTKINKDIPKYTSNSVKSYIPCIITKTINHNNTDLQVKIREWRNYDLEYWESYGISLKWLKYAEVYPISHKIIIKDNNKYVFGADKYAYAFVEKKEDKITLKVYQPFNKLGYKWSNKNDGSVIGLWTKVPQKGDSICICSSLKDALCLWANTDIPSVYLQGEGYKMSNTAINELKKRFNKVYICFDNDDPGILDANKLSKETGFINVVLPKIENAKDISDIFYALQDKIKFKKLILNLFN